MSSKAITERPDPEAPASAWKTARETAPSLMTTEEPVGARWIGGIGLFCLILGGLAKLVPQFTANKNPWISTWLGGAMPWLLLLFGTVGLLYHAARDTDLQFRRAYGFLGFLWLAVAVLLSVWPGPTGEVGGRFLPWGYASLIMALLFLMPFAHNESDPVWHKTTASILGGVGAVLALTGLIGGTISSDFFFSVGLVLSMAGLAYLWVFISLQRLDDNLGYRAGVAMGVLGLVVALIALVRSLNILGWTGLHEAPNYLQTTGFVLMAVGALYAGVAVGLCSENRFVVMTRRELAAFFYSPLAYFVLFAFSVVAAYQYADFVGDIMTAQARQSALQEPIIMPFVWSLVPVLSLVLVVPLLTMRLFSEEERTQTLEVLLTAPVREAPIVLSKFLAVLVVFMVVWVPYGLFLVALRVEGGQAFDYRPIVSFAIALLCCGAGFVAMGLFFSSLTRSQVVAGVFTAAGMVLLMVLVWVRRNIPQGSAWSSLLSYTSFVELWRTTLEGKLALRDIMFHLSAAVFWLFLTIKVLESRKWR
jgi:ABC-type transport system involved in multi-copper enzyme maturation permease subunit